MENKEFRANYESSENKNKTVWRNIGIGALSVFMALLTVLVINI